MEKIKQILLAPKRFIASRLVKRGLVARIISIEEPPPFGEYKIATAVEPDYEHLEIQANADLWK